MRIRARQQARGHAPAAHGGRAALGGRAAGVLDFSASITPAGCPPAVRAAIRGCLHSIEHYPDPASSALVEALHGYTGADPSRIVVGNGATEIIYRFCSTLLPAGAPVLTCSPTFAEYELAARLHGARVSFFRTMDLTSDLDAFKARIPRNGCVFVCNPNNPTGTLVPGGGMLEIIRAADRLSTLVLVDECFIEMVPGPDESVIESVGEFGGLLVLRSLTKSFGIPGLRLGYAAASPKIADVLRRTGMPWSVGSLAQAAGTEALRHPSHIARAKRMIAKEYGYLRGAISKIGGLECLDSAANFVLIRTRMRSGELQERLLARGILVRDCSNFRGLGGHYIRAAIRSHAENRALVRALEAIL